jgi:O-antigen/teichoic acid export membrane protein
MSLKQKIFDGTRWTSLSTVAQAAISFLVLFLVFHKLKPAEFGIFSLAQGVVNVGLALWGASIGNAIVAKEKLHQNQLSTLFWINIGGGVLVSVLITFMASLLAWFFGNSGLKEVLWLFSLIVPFTGVGQTHRFLLQRDLYFKKLTSVRLAGLTMHGTTAVIGVYLGFGVLALVGAYLLQAVIESVLLLWFGRSLLKPRFQLKFSESGYFFRFGFFQVMERLTDIFISQLDTFFLGKLIGMESLGLYDAAKRVLMRPLIIMGEALEAVVFPVMSKQQREPSILSSLFLQNVRFLFSIGLPVCIFFIFLATPFKEIFFGQNWTEAERVLQLMAVIMILRIPRIPTDALILAKSKTDWWFYWKIIVLPLMAAAIWLGAKAGLQGVLAAMIALHSLLLIMNYFLIVKNLAPVAIGAYFNCFCLIILLSVPAALTGWIASSIVVANWGKVFAFLSIFVCIYGLGMWIFQRNLLRVFFEFLNFKSSIMR